MIETITNFQFNSTLGIILYWLPVLICAFGYTIRTAKNFMKDKAAREKDSYYYPTDTIGTLIGRAFVSIIPVANLWAALFDISPQFFGNFFRWIGKVFNQPLVPCKKDRN